MQLRQLKQEMKRNIRVLRNSRDLVEFAFDQHAFSNLEWEEENEFCFKGEMYDVVETREVNGKFMLLCIPDKKETQLIHDFQEQTEKNQSRDKRLHFEWASSYLQPVSLHITLFSPFPDTTRFPEYVASIFSLPLSIVTPPPDDRSFI